MKRGICPKCGGECEVDFKKLIINKSIRKLRRGTTLTIPGCKSCDKNNIQNQVVNEFTIPEKSMSHTLNISLWRRCSNKTLSVIAIGVLTASLVPFNDSITNLTSYLLSAGKEYISDVLFPLGNDKRIYIRLGFRLPLTPNENNTTETLTTLLLPSYCKSAKKDPTILNNNDNKFAKHINSIVTVACRASGKTTVTMISQNGSPQTIYDDIPNGTEHIPFSGVPGSHFAGVLLVDLEDTNEPSGSWEPVNNCQRDNTCEDFFRHLLSEENQ